MAERPVAGMQTIYSLEGEKLFNGGWDPKAIFKAVSGGTPEYWSGKRVLDIGANTFGLSVELARAGASVVALEPDPFNSYAPQTGAIVEQITRDEGLKLDTQRAGLFDAGDYGKFDCVLLLGLIYHFRDPQYIIDYMSTLDLGDLVVSTQTESGDDLVLHNRRGIKSLPANFWDKNDVILSSWHPTRPLFERMLQWGGFEDVIALTDPNINFPKLLPGVTNSAYYRATKRRSVKPDAARMEYMPR